ncbi:hypothetical protein L1049_007150 [Liquidambar formosana]|uniref:Protein kinase domain-containing protein n=1 Tax=Liquidambar formosana TaxID=63359 RepID=A0AAP0RGR0_LIQFO
MEYLSTKRFPANSKDYKLYEEVGEGVSANVFRALCIPLNEIVAIKVLDLEKCNNDLDGIRREVQTMSLIDHSNLLRAHCSFTADRSLWVVMPYMAGGSCLHIMKSAYSEGFEQPVIATMLREVLKALVYLHAHGHIHRDVKAGNILVDSNGAVKLADFGVSACMFDTGDRQRSRNTFVGTPCWMAPEVMQQLHGYDFKADIWSFGITALELAHGHAPFSKYPPMKVLLMTLQNAPPGLDYERDKKFSKSFKEIVAACLVKDPKKRPTSEKLLKHPFFKHARSNDYLARTILDGLSPLGDRFRMLKEKEANLLVQNQAMYGDKEQLSQQEYMRGISAWNFDLEDLKKQAALIQDYDGFLNKEDHDLSSKQKDGYDNLALSADGLSVERLSNSISAPTQEDGLNNLQKVESSVASHRSNPLKALDGYTDVCVDDANAFSPDQKHASHSIFEHLESSSRVEDKEIKSIRVEDTLDDSAFQRKGRFKLTKADSSPKGFANGLGIPSVGGSISSATNTAASLLSLFQFILQQNAMQREQIMRLIRYVDQTNGHHMEYADVAGTNEHLQVSLASAKEKDLQSRVIHMQQSIEELVEELQEQKMKNAQLERQLSVLLNRE